LSAANYGDIDSLASGVMSLLSGEMPSKSRQEMSEEICERFSPKTLVDETEILLKGVL
jgi:hypothetical protein